MTSEQPLVAYQLDDPELTWPAGVRKPEGVLIGEHDGRSYVIFIELKATTTEDKIKDAGEQLASMIDHFHPCARTGGNRTHGDEHHDLWCDQDDKLEIMPDKEHQVICLAFFRRKGERTRLQTQRLGEKRVVYANELFHGAQYGRLERSLSDLVQQLSGMP